MTELIKKQSNKKEWRYFGKWLGVFLIAALFVYPGFSKGENGEVSRLDFIKLLAKEPKKSQLIPPNSSSLSDEKLFNQVTQNLKKNGFNVLVNKDPGGPLSQQEFVRLTYAFSGQPAGKSLFEQKQYLKNANIISTADVGLITGLQGRAVQYRDEEEGYSSSELAAPVFMQDRVETDLDSMITFTFDDGSTMSLGEDAVVNITEHIYDPDTDFRKTIVNVALGAVRFKVTKGKAEGSMFQVLTPVATAGVRGTEFVTIVEPGGKTKFVGIEGLVETFSRLPDGKEGKHQMVSAGTMNSVSENGTSTGVQKADAATLNSVIQKTSPNKTVTEQPMTMAKVIKATGANLGTGNTISNVVANNKTKGVANGLSKDLDGLAKETGKGSGKGPKKSFTQSASKDAAKNSAKTAAKVAAKEAAKNTAKQAAKNAAMQAAKDSIRASTKDVIKTTANTFQGIPDPGGNPNSSASGRNLEDIVGGLGQSNAGGIGSGGAGSLPGASGNSSCGAPPCGQAKGQGKGQGKGKGP